MIFHLPFDQIDGTRLEALRAEGVSEGLQLEYKEQLPGNGESDKKEFLYDVSALANAAGGDLIYGLREKRDSENRPTGEIDRIVGLQGLNVDAERLRLESSIRDGIAPRMPPVLFHPIPRGPDPPCLLVRVSASWASPHMVTLGGVSRFYSRTSGGKYQLAVGEIRAAFVAAEAAQERIRRLRTDRIMKAAARETPVPIDATALVILHALPMARAEEVWPRVQAMSESELGMALPPIVGLTDDWAFNLDGFVTYKHGGQCYLQLFRDGGIETLGPMRGDDKRGGLYGWALEEMVIGRFTQYKKVWAGLGVTPPLLVGLALLGMKGWKVLGGQVPLFGGERKEGLDRDVVVTPDIIVSDLNAPPDVALKPLFDFVWNGGGWPGSPHYREGRRVRPS